MMGADKNRDVVESIEDHMAFTCKCGSVHFNLLKTLRIECAGCGYRFGRWEYAPIFYRWRARPSLGALAKVGADKQYGWTATHLKTGNQYRVIGEAINATNAQDGQCMVIYERDGMKFVRESHEFQDKFAALAKVGADKTNLP